MVDKSGNSSQEGDRETLGHKQGPQHGSARHQVPSLTVCSPSKRKMQHISNLSIAVMYVMYFLAALFGYLTFYGMAGPAGAGGIGSQAGRRGLVSGHSD